MKSIGIAIFLITISSTVNAQSIGDLAKAERQRQQEIGSAKLTVKQINPIIETEQAAATPAPAPSEQSKAEQAKVEQPKNDHAEEQGSLEREKGALLLKLRAVIHDRKAVQDIEQRLGEIQRQLNELKGESKQDGAAKTEPKSDPQQK